LIFHRKRTQLVTNDRVREVASLIPNARLVTLDGDAGAPYWDHEQFIDIVYEFLGVPSTAKASAPSGMVVILFADIADSTGLTERLGDQAFRERARSLDAELRESISVHGGTPVEGKLLGDGVLATFASAAEAIECALRCVHDGNDAELPLHLGIHAGDVIREAGNVFGGAVNITSRISEASAAGEVLVSDVVRGLARTSAGVMFEDRCEFVLKGIGEPLRLFAVRAGSG